MLEIRSHLSNLTDQYLEGAKQKANFLIYSQSGAGKTHLLMTAPKPVLIHSFDPGGTRLRPMLERVKKGDIIIDDRFELEADSRPTVFAEWRQEFDRLQTEGAFDLFSTFVIDSGTLWLEAMMNNILLGKGRAGQTPQLQDYGTHQAVCRDYLKKITTIPCNFIFTCHVEMMKDDVDGGVHTSIMASGKNKIKIPILFDEVYYLEAKENREKKKIERTLLTSSDGRYHARTRIGSGVFATREAANLSLLMRKAWGTVERKETFIGSNNDSNEEKQQQPSTT